MKGSERWRRMGRVALAACAATGCDSDYTAAPTACDDWCHATLRANCDGDKPHECVRDCASKPAAGCSAAQAALTDCYSAASNEDFHCEGDENGKSAPNTGLCQAEHDALFACQEPVLAHCLTTCADRALSAQQSFEGGEHDANASWACRSLNDDCLCACYTLDFLGQSPSNAFFDCLEGAAVSQCALGPGAPPAELSGAGCKPPGVFASCTDATGL